MRSTTATRKMAACWKLRSASSRASASSAGTRDRRTSRSAASSLRDGACSKTRGIQQFVEQQRVGRHQPGQEFTGAADTHQPLERRRILIEQGKVG